jgi:hypothetical protein
MRNKLLLLLLIGCTTCTLVEAQKKSSPAANTKKTQAIEALSEKWEAFANPFIANPRLSQIDHLLDSLNHHQIDSGFIQLPKNFYELGIGSAKGNDLQLPLSRLNFQENPEDIVIEFWDSFDVSKVLCKGRFMIRERYDESIYDQLNHPKAAKAYPFLTALLQKNRLFFEPRYGASFDAVPEPTGIASILKQKWATILSLIPAYNKKYKPAINEQTIKALENKNVKNSSNIDRLNFREGVIKFLQKQ